MATNLTHVRSAYETLRDRAESAKGAIEDKENVTDRDEGRIDAYEEFLDAIESAFCDLEGALQS